MRKGSRTIVCAATILSLVLWASSCAVNPVSGNRELMLLSETDELRLGRRTDGDIVREYGIYDDQNLNARLREIGNRLGTLSHRPHLTYRFKVLDASVVNAFAVPGGYIYLTRGILAHLNSEAELAGIMGHEIGHVTARHSGQQYTRAQLAQIGMGIGMIFSDTFSSLSSLVEMGVGMLFLSYSRDNERQADALGVEYSAKAGYDPGEMAGFFSTLERMNPSSDRTGLPSWLSTHPNPEDRIGLVRTMAQEWRQTLNLRNARIGREEYLRGIDGLIIGDDPKQGYVKDHVFYHPSLCLEIPLPGGWSLKNNPSQVQMVSENKDAAILLTMGKGATPREAARSFVSKSGAVVRSSDPIQVNNLSAHRLVMQLKTQKGSIGVVSYFIELEKQMIVLHGVSSPGVFQRKSRIMEETMHRFKKLTDRNRMDVEPDRLRIKTVKHESTLGEALLSLGVPKDELMETALLNGLSPDDRVGRSSLIKVIEKGCS